MYRYINGPNAFDLWTMYRLICERKERTQGRNSLVLVEATSDNDQTSCY